MLTSRCAAFPLLARRPPLSPAAAPVLCSSLSEQMGGVEAARRMREFDSAEARTTPQIVALSVRLFHRLQEQRRPGAAARPMHAKSSLSSSSNNGCSNDLLAG